jgi:hypothetical protein
MMIIQTILLLVITIIIIISIIGDNSMDGKCDIEKTRCVTVSLNTLHGKRLRAIMHVIIVYINILLSEWPMTVRFRHLILVLLFVGL